MCKYCRAGKQLQNASSFLQGSASIQPSTSPPKIGIKLQTRHRRPGSSPGSDWTALPTRRGRMRRTAQPRSRKSLPRDRWCRRPEFFRVGCEQIWSMIWEHHPSLGLMCTSRDAVPDVFSPHAPLPLSHSVSPSFLLAGFVSSRGIP